MLEGLPSGKDISVILMHLKIKQRLDTGVVSFGKKVNQLVSCWMADQRIIQNKVEELSKKFGTLQQEVIDALLELVEGKSNKEALAVLNEIDINRVIELKSTSILSSFDEGMTSLLGSKELFAPITEGELRSLLTASEQYFTGEMTSMGNTLKQEVINGIINKRTPSEILDAIKSKGYGPDVGMKRIVTDSMNNYSRSVSRLMMEEAPVEAKYIYIGPADEKTRDFCLSAIQLGAVTLKEIESMGGEFTASLTEGGGINCRHSWELASSDVRSQFFRKEEAEELIDNAW